MIQRRSEEDGKRILKYCTVEMSVSKIMKDEVISHSCHYQFKRLLVLMETHRNKASKRRRFSKDSKQAIPANLEKKESPIQIKLKTEKPGTRAILL